MWILARTSNGRPTLMHQLEEDFGDKTSCGLEVNTWSRAYRARAVKEIACKKCAKKARGE